MANFTLTQDTNIQDLTGRIGGSVITTNGFSLTIDQDIRYGLNSSVTSTLGSFVTSNISESALIITTERVRYIPYTGGSGTVPAYNTLISRGGANGRLLTVQSSLAAVPTNPGAAMPASGWIKIKTWNEVSFSAGALTGINATASGPDVQGVIDIAADVGTTLTLRRLFGFKALGGMVPVGTTSGASGTVYQLPTMGAAQWYAGVQVETAVGSNEYDWWPNVGADISRPSGSATDAIRGKLCHINSSGQLRLGSNHSGQTAGNTPGVGRRIRSPSILLNNCAVAARQTNVAPGASATVAARYSLQAASSSLTMTGVNYNWGAQHTNCATYVAQDVCMGDVVSVTGAGAYSIDNLCAGTTSTTAGIGSISVSGLTSPTTINKLTLAVASNLLAATRLSNIVFNDLRVTPTGVRTATRNAIFTQGWSNIKINGLVIGNGNFGLGTYAGLEIKDMVYWSGYTATTTAFTENVIALTATALNVSNLTIDGFRFATPDSWPHNGYAMGTTTGNSYQVNTLLRNFGSTTEALVPAGTTFQGIAIMTNATNGAGYRFERCYDPNSVFGLANVGTGAGARTLQVTNCRQSDSLTTNFNMPFSVVKGLRSGRSTFESNAYYPGSVFYDGYASDTVGYLGITMSDTSADMAPYITLAGGAGFTADAAGGISMRNVGDSATIEFPWTILAHTGFANAAVAANIALGNFTFAYQINTGSGFGAWSAELTAAQMGTALNALGAIDPATGFGFKIRMTTASANTATVQFLRVTTTTTLAAQNTNLYPLDTFTITFDGLPTGCDAFILQAGTTTLIDQRDQLPGASYSYTYDVLRTVDIGFVKPGFQPFYIRNLSLTASNVSIPVALVPDRNYQP